MNKETLYISYDEAIKYLEKSWLVVLLNEYTSTQITTRIRIPFLEVHSCLWCKNMIFCHSKNNV